MKPKLKKSPRWEDEIAANRVEKLLENARERLAAGDGEGSRRFVGLARKIAMRHRLKLGSVRFCKKCNNPFIAGKTCKTRIIQKKSYRVCSSCGNRTLSGKAAQTQ